VNEVVKLERNDAIAIVTVNSPPARRWDGMRATHQVRGRARRRNCDQSPLSSLDASLPAAADELVDKGRASK